jgi:hypothetical protein
VIKRTTESDHPFIHKLYTSINAFHIEGLTMDESRNFSAIIEAIQFSDDEVLDIREAFSTEDIMAKFLLSTELDIPLFFVCLHKKVFTILRAFEQKIVRDDAVTFSEVSFSVVETLDEAGFVVWWSKIKKTSQTHPLNNGANSRTSNTVFDQIIESKGYAWGGNIDALVVNSDFTKVLCVIDDISIAFVSIDNNYADPARFFHKRGPIYNTWLSTVKLANMLNVPHILLTKDANNGNDEVVGISVIDHLDTSGIFYVDKISPPQRIVKGIDTIQKSIMDLIASSIPPVYK